MFFAPQLGSFFRARSRELALAEGLAQEVMLTVYRKAEQIWNRASFRGWLFKIAHNALCRSLSQVDSWSADREFYRRWQSVSAHNPAGTPAFELRNWMVFLDAQERDVMMLRFVEQWEYDEIAIRGTPIGTIQWRIFNSKKKLASHLNTTARCGPSRLSKTPRKE
jgi:RNA polymerase sigma-70 factor (ECF subfamily)